MANRIKGITVEIGGDTTKLQNALKGVNSQIKSTESQLKDVNKLLKLDPGNTDLIAQKYKLLQQEISSTKEKLASLKQAQQQADKALAEGTISKEQYDALQREIIETEQSLKKLESAAKESAKSMDGIVQKGEKLKTAGDKVTSIGEKFMPVTAGVAALGTAALKTAADFDTAMSKVAAVSGATGDDLEQLKKKAREMGAKTKFSASEAAEAMNYMAMAGWKTGDMLAGIEGVMNLAAASGTDLAVTSDIVTDALTAFGLTAADSGHFADILAAASSNANTNVEMMGETFKYVAPIAGALGFSAEDTAEAIGLMANAGIKSTQAGTSLRSIMNNLAGDVKFTGAAFGEMQIATTNTDGSMRNLSDILSDCRSAFSQMTESEKAANAEALVGKNAMSGFLAIMNAGEADVTKLNDAISNCDGTAEKMAETMQDNLAGQLTILKSQLQELAISFGELLMPAIRTVVSGIQKVIDVLNSLPTGVKEVIMIIALLVAAIGPMLIIAGKVMSGVGAILTVIPKLASVIGVVQKAMAALNLTMYANPIVLIIMAIVALVAAFIYFWNTSDEFRQFWIDLWEGIKEVAIAVWDALVEFFTAAWDAIKTTAETIWNAISEFFSGLWNGIKEIFTTVVDAISTFLSTAWETIKSVVETVWNAIKEFFLGIWNGIKEIFTTVLDTISGFLSSAWEGIKSTAETIWNAISDFFSSLWEGIKNVISTVVNTIKDIISNVWNGIKDVVSSIGEGIKNAAIAIWDNITSAIGGFLGNIIDSVTGAFNAVKDFICNLASEAFNWGKDFIMGIVNGIKSCIGAVVDAVTSVGDKIKSFLHFSVPDEGPLTDYESWMPDFMKGLAKGINKSKYLVSDAMKGLAGDMVISPSLDSSNLAMTNGMTASVSGDNSDLVGAMKDAISQGLSEQGDTIIPVYIGNRRIEDIVVNATQRMNYRSGGR